MAGRGFKNRFAALLSRMVQCHAEALQWQLCPPQHERHAVLGILDRRECVWTFCAAFARHLHCTP